MRIIDLLRSFIKPSTLCFIWQPQKTLKFGPEELGEVSFFNPPPDVWLSHETLLNVIHFSVFENK